MPCLVSNLTLDITPVNHDWQYTRYVHLGSEKSKPCHVMSKCLLLHRACTRGFIRRSASRSFHMDRWVDGMGPVEVRRANPSRGGVARTDRTKTFMSTAAGRIPTPRTVPIPYPLLVCNHFLGHTLFGYRRVGKTGFHGAA